VTSSVLTVTDRQDNFCFIEKALNKNKTVENYLQLYCFLCFIIIKIILIDENKNALERNLHKKKQKTK
jgi:hypothetical protein